MPSVRPNEVAEISGAAARTSLAEPTSRINIVIQNPSNWTAPASRLRLADFARPEVAARRPAP